QLHAAEAITRVVKGLPDEFDGMYKGKGVGRVPILTPYVQFLPNVGIEISTSLANAVSDPSDLEKKIVNGFIVFEGPTNPSPVNIRGRWSPMRPTNIDVSVSTIFYSIGGVNFRFEFGFRMGFTV